MTATALLPVGEEGKTLGSWVHDRLRDDIIAGQLPPGQKLTLDTLKERYAVGATPLREALYRLSSSMLVIAEDQRGFRVAPVTLMHLEDIIASRQHVEVLVLRDAFKNGDNSWIARIHGAFLELHDTRMYNESTGLITREWENVHRNFHRAVLSSAKSQALLHFQTMLWDHAARYRNIAGPAVLEESTLDGQHEKLWRAIESRDEEMACILLRRHIMGAAAPVFAALAELERGKNGQDRDRQIFEKI